MNLANMLTLLRIILAPVFFIIYLSHHLFPSLFENGAQPYVIWTIPVLWVIFIVSEITDYFDGLAARKLNMTSDFGKLFDPFADTIVQITCFLCFIIDGIFPAWAAILFLLVIYREFGILFLRNLMLKKGVTLGARLGGKIKTVAYIIAVGVALLAASFERSVYHHTQVVSEQFLQYLKTGAFIIFILSVIIAIVSFVDYVLIYQKTKVQKN